jgi:plasmid stability protein
MVWFYFGSGHGKGVHDGVRTILKQEIQKEQMNMNSEWL